MIVASNWSLSEIASVVDNPRIGTDPDGEPMLRCGCPAHGGTARNCAIRYGSDGKLLATCHSRHCEFTTIISTLREKLGDDGPMNGGIPITVGKGTKQQAPAKLAERGGDKTWELKDATGKVVALHVRKNTKDGKIVFWKQPGGSMGLNGTSTNDLPLYGAELVARSRGNIPVVLTEGEKAADALREAGILGVGTVTGADGTPGAESLEVLRNRRVVLWPDKDKPGFEHMGRLAEGLHDIVSELLWYEWSGAPEKGDAADHPSPNITELLAAPRWSRSPAIEGMIFNMGTLIRAGVDPPEELLPDILLVGKAHNIYAPGGVGKTWVLIWLAKELLSRGKRVAVFDLENGQRTYLERLEEAGANLEALDRNFAYGGFVSLDPASYTRFLDEWKPDIVMFDSWIGFLAQYGKDENVSNDISAWAEAYSKPALKRGCAVLNLDHVPHDHERERGSSRKRDEMDVVWKLTKLGDFDRENTATLAMSRQKDREGWLPEKLTFEIGGDPGTGRFVMRRTDELVAIQITQLTNRERVALDALEPFENGARAGEWLEAIRDKGEDVSRRAMYRIRDSLLQKGKLEEVKTDTAYGGVQNVRYMCAAQPAQQEAHGAPGVVRIVHPPTGGGTSQRTTPSADSPVSSPLFDENQERTTPPAVGGFGTSREEREEKYAAQKEKLREWREERF